MFCGKCGLKLNSGEDICPSCGWRTPQEKDVTPDSEAQEQINNASAAVDSPANFDYDEPSRQSFDESEYFPPVPGELSCQSPEPPENADAKKKSGKKRLVIAAVAAAALLVIGVGIFADVIIYHGTDSYKISKAEDLILSGEYSEAIDIISDIKSDESDAVRGFAELLKLKDAYLEDYDPDRLQTDSDPVKASGDSLVSAYEGYKGFDSLPDKLRSRYNTIRDRMADRASARLAVNREDLKAAQRSIFCFKQRKEGASFTISELEELLSSTEPAVLRLETNLINKQGFRSFYEDSGSLAAKALSGLCAKTSAQVAQDRFDADNYLKTQKRGDSLRLNETVTNYDAEVAEGLKCLNSEADIDENAGLLTEAVPYAWLAYAFSDN